MVGPRRGRRRRRRARRPQRRVDRPPGGPAPRPRRRRAGRGVAVRRRPAAGLDARQRHPPAVRRDDPRAGPARRARRAGRPGHAAMAAVRDRYVARLAAALAACRRSRCSATRWPWDSRPAPSGGRRPGAGLRADPGPARPPVREPAAVLDGPRRRRALPRRVHRARPPLPAADLTDVAPGPTRAPHVTVTGRQHALPSVSDRRPPRRRRAPARPAVRGPAQGDRAMTQQRTPESTAGADVPPPPGDPRGLHAAVRAAQLPEVVHAGGRRSRPSVASPTWLTSPSAPTSASPTARRTRSGVSSSSRWS